MALTVQDVAASQPLASARLVAVEASLTREIRGVLCPETLQDLDRLKGGELVFAQWPAEAGLAAIKQARQAGAAAVVMPQTYATVQICQWAEAHGLPLFLTSGDLSLSRYMAPIWEQLVNQQFRLVHTTENIHKQLLEKINNNKGLAGICDTVEKLNGSGAVCLLDKRGQIKAAGGGDDEYHWECYRKLTDYLAKVGKDAFTHLPAGHWHTYGLPQDNYVLMVAPIFWEEGYQGALVLVDQADTLSELAQTSLEYAATLMSMELMREEMLLEKERQIYGEILDDLLEYNYREEGAMLRRARYININLNDPYLVFALDVDDFEQTLGQGQAMSEQQVHDLKKEMQNTFRRLLGRSYNQMLLVQKSDGMIGLLPCPKEGELPLDEALAAAIGRMEKRFRGFTFTGGLGRQQQGVDNVRKAADEALLAIDISRKMHMNKKVVSFEELGIFRFLHEVRDSQMLKEFFLENCKALLQYDIQNDFELFKTLKTYYANWENVSKTAEALYLHKNTVIYRLKKIEKIQNIKLSDYEQNFNLQFCLKIFDLLGKDAWDIGKDR